MRNPLRDVDHADVFVHALVLFTTSFTALVPTWMNASMAVASIAAYIAHHGWTALRLKLDRDLNADIRAAIQEETADTHTRLVEAEKNALASLKKVRDLDQLIQQSGRGTRFS